MQGGYIFRKVDLTYDPNTNGASVLSWAQAIHSARCSAFAEAAEAEKASPQYGWYTFANPNYAYPTTSMAGGPITLDIHSGYSDYPAYMTIFRNYNTYSEYCILTYTGFNSYSPWETSAPPSNGLYIHKNNLTGGYNGSWVNCGASMAHCFAKQGGFLNTYNVKSSSFLINNCTYIMPAYSSLTVSDNSAGIDTTTLIQSRVQDQNSPNLVGKTFQFGYAIRGDKIISMMRNSNSPRWLWSIIGEIFDVNMRSSDENKVGCLVNDYAYDSVQEINESSYIYTNTTSNLYGNVSACLANNSLYRPIDWSNVIMDFSRGTTGYISPSSRVNIASLSNEIPYNAVAVGASASSFSLDTQEPGFDGNGNGCKGFIDTSLLRQVSAGACQSCGKLLQGGNFVTMAAGSVSSSGFILGWDSSNGSIE